MFRTFLRVFVLAALFVSSFGSLAAAQDFALKGVANFRDIGGYPAGAGHEIKKGVIFRSGELSGVTPADLQVIAGLKIRYEIDLRTDAERSANPSNWGSKAPQVIAISISPNDGSMQATSRQQFESLKTASDAKKRMQEATATIAIGGAENIGKVLGDLAKGTEPALIHCSAGKDRTGVTVAVLMTILGASREDVYHEYMRSNESVAAQLERQKAREQSGKDVFGMSRMDPAVMSTMLGTDPSYLDAVFREINVKYGSFDGYTRDGLKLTAVQIAQLRKNLIK
jgi:protein-tyrosine phosphatase